MTELQLLSVSMRDKKPAPGADWFRIVLNKKTSVAKVYIYDEIGYWGTTAKDFAAQINELEEDTIELHLNSPGGSVFDGLAIMAALRDHKAKVVAHVDGMAASAASFILQAATDRIIGRNAQIMIHDAKAYAGGNAAQMRKAADLLDRVSNNIADIYAVRSGQGTVQSWRDIMVSGDTWYDGNEALEAGLVDTVLDNPEEEDEDENNTSNSWSVEEVTAFIQTPVEKLAASGERPSITNRVEEALMTGTAPQNNQQQPAVPTPPAPQAAPVAQVSYPEALNMFVVKNEGQADQFDFNALASEITALRGFKKETIETSRKDFVKNLVQSGKIMGDEETVKNAEAFVLGLSNEQFGQYKASMTSAPTNALFTVHGSGGAPTGPQSVVAQSEKDRIQADLDIQDEIVEGHRQGGMPEDVLKTKSSYIKAQSLREQLSKLA